MALDQTQILLEVAKAVHGMATVKQENEAYMLAERLKEEQIVQSAKAAQLRDETEQITQGVEVA